MAGLTSGMLLAADTARLGDALGGWGKLVVAAAVFAVSIFAAVTLGKRLRMPDYTSKIALALFVLLSGLAITVTGWPPHLGIDLSGGVVLIYELDQSQIDPNEPFDDEKMERMLAAIARRVNPAGIKEVVIREYGDQKIEIIIPEVDEAEVARIQKTVSSIGSLEFRILANRFDHRDLISRAEKSVVQELRDGDDVVARWVPIAQSKEENIVSNRDFAIRKSARTDLEQWEVLVAIDSYNVTGQFLTRASTGADQNGRPKVNFQFNSEGAKWFGRLSGENLPDQAQNRVRHLAILLDGFIYSAPTIQARITDRGEITGRFTEEEVDDLVSVLNAGSLPTALNKEPISRLVTGPRLGQDSVNKGQTAMLISIGAVLVFMAAYYRFAGFIACGALVANIVLVLAAMITFHARFTLTGLAGLILTVGMAVDANVLIFERIREELGRGAALRMAIRNGFSRATTTIVDSNVTTLITAVVLYAIGTDQVKGFAVTLFLGIVMSMFTAIICARLVFDIAERRRWITRLNMMHWIGDTKIEFVGYAKPAMAASLVVIAVGMVGTWYRGNSLLDIDFTGGTSVTTLLEPDVEGSNPPPVTITDVRQRVTNISDEVQQEVRELLSTTRRAEMINAIRGDLGLSTSTEDDQQQIEEEFQKRLDLWSTLPDVVVSSLELDLPDDLDPGDESTGDGVEDGNAAEPPAADLAAAESATAESYFLINTSNPDVYAVEEIIKRVMVFDHYVLATNHVEIGPMEMIEATIPVDTVDGESTTPPVGDSPAVDGASNGENDSSSDSPGGCQDPAEEDATDADEPADSDEGNVDEPESNVGQPAPEADPADETPGDTADSADGDVSDEATDNAPVVMTDELFAGGATTTMTFSQKISHAVLMDRFDRAFTATERERVPVALSNPNYDPGSDVPQDEWTVRVALSPDEAQAIFSQVAAEMAAEPYFPSSNKIGGSVASDARQQALFAILASLVAIVGYIWIRFQRVTYGLAAVVALVHDVLITLGALAVSYWLADALGFLLIEPFKISLPIVAAFLTIIGYSLNDTIVVFDRIREVKGKSPRITSEIINRSVNQTLARTVLTAVTTLIVVLILYAIGGQGIHGFAFCMVIGVVVGTYSSVFVASPILLWLSNSGGPAVPPKAEKKSARTSVGSA